MISVKSPGAGFHTTSHSCGHGNGAPVTSSHCWTSPSPDAALSMSDPSSNKTCAPLLSSSSHPMTGKTKQKQQTNSPDTDSAIPAGEHADVRLSMQTNAAGGSSSPAPNSRVPIKSATNTTAAPSARSPSSTARALCLCCIGLKSKATESSRGVPSNESQSKVEAVMNDECISIKEVKNWATSFDNLMASSVGREIFQEFLKMEYSEENILFWEACEGLKHERDGEVIEEKARMIYDDYISILSPKEVSLDSRVREVINTNMVHPDKHTFDEAQQQIYTLMQRDSYSRFINSSIYKEALCRAGASPSHSPQGSN